jgi:hypothetical protein
VEFDWKNIDVDPESMNDELRQYVTDHFPDAVFPDSEDDLSLGKILSGRLGIGESEDDDDEENSESEEEDDEGAADDGDDDDDDGIDYYHPRDRATKKQPLSSHPSAASQQNKALRTRKVADGRDKRGGKKQGQGQGRGKAKKSEKASHSSLKEVERRHKVR